MKVLQTIGPTDEQLKIISSIEPKLEVIRGAAGSGKTTTAILRLRGLIGNFVHQRRRLGSQEPVRALVLTFNRTLRGYIEQLVLEQVQSGQNVQIEIETFARWANHLFGYRSMLTDEERRAAILPLAEGIPLPTDFLCAEIDYILGLYLPENWPNYLTSERTGRGPTPRIDRSLRVKILNDIVRPYADWKRTNAKYDWSDMEVELATTQGCEPYDIIIADETQDFSANQVRALLKHRAEVNAVSFIVDSAQRIYSRGFTWKDVGILVGTTNSHRLSTNYRNTCEIAALAAPLVKDIANADTDATIPDLNKCTRHGPLPELLVGKFSQQINYTIEFTHKNIDLTKESVAFLQPLGGRWFDATKAALHRADLPFVEITRKSDWPQGSENIAISTIHSAKGLEFDHIFLLGLNSENLTHGAAADDDDYLRLRRLLAMAICRARNTVTMGAKREDRSDLLALLEAKTFKEVIL